MKENFVPKSFRDDSLQTIEWINDVLERYRSLGYDLTVRQVYYQLVAQALIPNNLRSYKRVQGLISDGRKAGLIDWSMIVDRTRGTQSVTTWENPGEIAQAAVDSYRVDVWANQPCHVEVMCEKEALSGILGPACRELRVNFTSNRGYASDSLMYRVAKRIGRKAEYDGKDIHIFYFGDHDPSGLDMDRDIEERVYLFSDSDLSVERLALLTEQVHFWSLPENPAKQTDSRFDGYASEYGEASWELDAVEPTQLVSLITDRVEELIDQDQWAEDQAREEQGREELQEFADQYK